jgi:hypothetical protein
MDIDLILDCFEIVEVSEARNKANAFICMYRHFSCVNGTGNQKSYYRYLFIGK